MAAQTALTWALTESYHRGERLGSLNAFSSWPKAELHVHLDGSLRPETVWELAHSEGVSLPFADRAALARRLRVPRRCTLPAYLEAFRYTVAVLQSEAALCRAAREFVADVAAAVLRFLIDRTDAQSPPARFDASTIRRLHPELDERIGLWLR